MSKRGDCFVTPFLAMTGKVIASAAKQSRCRSKMEGENTYKGPPYHVPDPLTIGGFINGVDPVGGILDEIGIFNKALSDNDIENIMTHGLEYFVLAIEAQGKLTTTWAKIKCASE